jgi:glycosyltransferase involved in cell wall biosynthesis
MNIVHLTASTFHGGPERQMLGLARSMAERDQSVFLSFAESGRCRSFLAAVRKQGFEGVALEKDTPRFRAAIGEIAEHLQHVQADVLCCHGYKANLLGRPAARRRGIPVIAVSRGWTGESFRVRWYERLDRFHLRWMDHTVCVSQAQADKVRRAGVRPERITVIHNAVDPERFIDVDPRYRDKLLKHFRPGRKQIIGAAGRLSPEKGFHVLVSAAAQVIKNDPSTGFILFGEGKCRPDLLRQINEAGLSGHFILSGFRADLDRFLPHLDLLVLPSFTEGLPNVVLEACAAGVPVVATAVGGTPEVVEDGVNGHLVPAGNADAMASRIAEVLASEERSREMGFQGRQRVLERFSFRNQVTRYRELFATLCPAQPEVRQETGEEAKRELTAQPSGPAEADPAATVSDTLVAAEPTCER